MSFSENTYFSNPPNCSTTIHLLIFNTFSNSKPSLSSDYWILENPYQKLCVCTTSSRQLFLVDFAVLSLISLFDVSPLIIAIFFLSTLAKYSHIFRMGLQIRLIWAEFEFFFSLDYYDSIHVTMHLSRDINHYILQVYFPYNLIVMLSWVGFWIDYRAANARVVLDITSMLTITMLGIFISVFYSK